MANPNPSTSFKQNDLHSWHRAEEVDVLQYLLQAYPPHYEEESTQVFARNLIESVRNAPKKKISIEHFLHTHRLNSQEGLALMCLAEALLRIPDSPTQNAFIRDKAGQADWLADQSHHPLFAKLTQWGMNTTYRVLNAGNGDSPLATLTSLVKRFGAPVIRSIMIQAVKIIGQQFVMGETIEKAIKSEENNWLYSYDMLGEAAITAKDADHYFEKYIHAIQAIAGHIATKPPASDIFRAANISVKLSALHPRYEWSQHKRVMNELCDRLLHLAQLAADNGIGLTVDAEESERLILSLNVIRTVFDHPNLKDREGLGLAVQAYQKRALPAIQHIHEWTQSKRIGIRLVKGAYWDSEIKRNQVQGYDNYPLLTQKSHTDISYLVCSQALIQYADRIYPQFATHNAYTIASVQKEAERANVTHFEYQRLHGMGESLYQATLPLTDAPCRVYAPVGPYRDLLSYLVRRLLENGANSNFVHQLNDPNYSIEKMIENPFEKLEQTGGRSHPQIPKPANILNRTNTLGIDLSDENQIQKLQAAFDGMNFDQMQQKIPQTDASSILKQARENYRTWSRVSVENRVHTLEMLAEKLQEHRDTLLFFLIKEAHKTWADAIADWREAVDFCHYYAAEAKRLMSEPTSLKGPTGESNQLTYHPRGIFLCVSPWNFPLAIFVGQIAAAFVTGNSVIAKPAECTYQIALYTSRLMSELGIPVSLACLPGSVVSEEFVPKVDGIVFTGSTSVAQNIARTLANRPGPLIPLIAETGGLNAMVVDSSALPEQVARDVLVSGFQSAGQRCSALRILCLQNDIADHVIDMIKGAMTELNVGDPFLIETDVGPVIHQKAKNDLMAYIERLKERGGQLIQSCESPDSDALPFIAPQLWEISRVEDVQEEAFGPIVHVVRFEHHQLDALIDSINSTGYGLTFGLHTRLESTLQQVLNRIQAGNIYINRSIIGAVVGVQPFGGEGLSGTGFKAGGPNYLLRFVTERTITQDLTASGGNAALLDLV